MTNNPTNTSHDLDFDIAVIGAGIAGASLAYELSGEQRVLLLEGETQPGYHTTGRSAALFCASYGNAVIRMLTLASRDFLLGPPPGFSAVPLLSARGTLLVARSDQLERMHALAAELGAQGSGTSQVDAHFARTAVPQLRPDVVAGAIHEPGAMDIDVHALHHGYLRGARSRGATVQCDAAIDALRREGNGWCISSRDRTWSAACIVNAAGAWADEVAAIAGAAPLNLVPMRRTSVTVDLPAGVDARQWPAVIDIDEQFYFKPDSGRLLLSPADETPSAPCDAQPEELDIAICVDRVQSAMDLPVARIAHAWAGLRTFASDRTPVVGFDPNVPGLFWLAGQGGYGIQTAPALSRMAAWMLQGCKASAPLSDADALAAALSPTRFR